MLVTSLNRILAHRPCGQEPGANTGWSKLLSGLGKTSGDDEPLPYARIVEINGLDDALWACRAESLYAREWRLFAVWAVRQVPQLMTDPRSLAALDVAERHANGLATNEELAAANANTTRACGSILAGAASVAAYATAYATVTDASAAAANAAYTATMATASGAAAAAYANANAIAASAVYATVRATAKAAQRKKFLEIVG